MAGGANRSTEPRGIRRTSARLVLVSSLLRTSSSATFWSGRAKRETETPLVNWNVWFLRLAAFIRLFRFTLANTRVHISAAGFRPRAGTSSSFSPKGLRAPRSATSRPIMSVNLTWRCRLPKEKISLASRFVFLTVSADLMIAWNLQSMIPVKVFRVS